MLKQNIALVDIGSNSIRLVIFQLDESGYYKEIQNLKVVARLSSHIDSRRIITTEGIEKLLQALQQFQEITRTYNVTKTKCVATAAIRQAKNQADICQLIENNTDFSIRVLSEFEEAYMGYLAVTNSTSLREGICIDIGGGSTEVTYFSERKLIHYHSFPFGAITLKQRFLHTEIPTKEELLHLQDFLLQEFQTLSWLNGKQLPVIGIGGSARNLSVIHQRKTNYPLSGLHQYTMALENIKEIATELLPLSVKQRQLIDGLSKDRADIIIPASVAIVALMETANTDTFIMSNKGLRDGLFYEELFTELNIEGFSNVADESFYQLHQDYKVDQSHVQYVSKIATQLFEELNSYCLQKLKREDLRILQLSCRVLYLGEFISRESSSEHTFYLLTNLSIDGLTHFERLKVALVASFKSRRVQQSYLRPFQDWFSDDELDKLEFLGALLKFSYSLNRTKQQVLSRLEVIGHNPITIALYFNKGAFFEQTQAQKNKKHLEKAISKQVNLEFMIN